MTRTKNRPKPLPTIWEIPDELWRRIEPILREYWPKKPTGRKVANWRKMLNGIIFRMRSGCQWDQLPERYGPKSTVHDWFQRWCAGGVMQRIWEELAKECDELGEVDWQWPAADGRLGKARRDRDNHQEAKPKKVSSPGAEVVKLHSRSPFDRPAGLARSELANDSERSVCSSSISLP